MAGAVADETIIAIRAEVDRAVSEFRKVQGEISGVEKSAKSSQKATDSAVTSLGTYARRLLIAVGAVKGIMQGIDFNVFMESQQLAFSVMLKDTDLAIEKMDEFRTMALSLPITFREVAAGARQLLAYGIPEKDLTETLGMLGDITRALSIPMGDLIYLYGTLRTQGRAYARDLMQFGMRGIPIYESLSEVMQVPINRIRDMTKEGEVGFYEV
jgi:hypothetical protein